jgi:hypothetical protein
MHWVGSGHIAVAQAGLAAWLAPLPGLLTAVAVALLCAGAWAVWRGNGSMDSLFRWSALSLSLALFASYHVQHYYYFVPLGLLLFHEMALLGKQGSESQIIGSLRDAAK